MNLSDINLPDLLRPKGAFYDPPYDSPIQDLLVLNLVKYLSSDVCLNKEIPIQTFLAEYRIDLVMTMNGVNVGLECDGAEYHDGWRDEWRDAIILATGQINNIWRIPGKAIHSRINIVLLHLVDEYPNFFTTKGKNIIEDLAFNEGRMIMENRHMSSGDINSYLLENDNGRDTLKNLVYVADRSDRHWQKLYEFALVSGLHNLDQIIKKYEQETFNF